MGFTHTQRDWRAGGSVGSPQGQLPGRESAALRIGLKGGPKIPPGSGCNEHWSGLEERPGSGKTPWWSAGWRAAPVWAAAHPHPVSTFKVRQSALRSLSPVERRRKGHEGAPRHRLNGAAERWLVSRACSRLVLSSLTSAPKRARADKQVAV